MFWSACSWLQRKPLATFFPFFAVVNQERKVAIVFRQRNALLRVLHRDQALLHEITSDEVPGRDCHPLKYARPDHGSLKVKASNHVEPSACCTSRLELLDRMSTRLNSSHSQIS